MSYRIQSPLPTEEGGTEKSSFTANTVICGGTTSTNPLQNVADTGNVYDVLTSQGAGALPEWEPLNNATFFEPLASDPGSPALAQTWYNTTSQEFKGAVCPVTGSWSVKTAMNLGRHWLATAGLDTDAIIAFGGRNDGIGDLSTNELYSKIGNSWTSKASMNESYDKLAGGGMDSDTALSCQGDHSTVATNQTELYSLSGNVWTNKQDTPATNTWSAAAVFDSDTFFNFGISASCYIYSIASNTWSNKSGMNTTRDWLGGGGFNSNEAISFGGRHLPGLSPLTTTEIYNLDSNIWSNVSSMNTARRQLGGTDMGSNLAMAIGGLTTTLGSSYTNTTEMYNKEANIWCTSSTLNASVCQNSANNFDDSSLISCGGTNSSSDLTTTELYDYTGYTIVVFDITAV